MSTGVAGRAQEPSLAVQPKFFRRRRFLWSFLPFACVAVLGATALVSSGQALVPFERVVTLEGRMASKRDFFEDAQVRELLLSHGIRVHITASGSREAVTGDLSGVDFVFPSGLPAARLVLDQRRERNEQVRTSRPFVSPIVLATYRPYAEALRANGIATPQDGDGSLYYDLDMERFVELVASGRTWNEVGIELHGARNGNRVLAQIPSVCNANSAATYLAMVAFAVDGRPPTTEQEADDVAARIRPLLDEQGQPISDLKPLYLSAEGRTAAQLVVIYEHQYLAHQLGVRERTGALDTERVLLYPSAVFQTLPEFISLTDRGDRLRDLIDSDPGLRRRAMELGFRLLDPAGENTSDQLSVFLREKGVPEPVVGRDDTRTFLPELPLMERMIDTIGGCS